MVSITAGNKGTIKSHTVWKYYLKQFSLDDKNIYSKNVKTGEICSIPIKDATVSPEIYRINKKISQQDINFFKDMLGGQCQFDDSENKIIDELVGFINNDIRPFKQLAEDKYYLFQNLIDKYIDNNALNRNQEELFSFYEDNFFKLYKKLLEKDTTFFNSLYSNDYMCKGFVAARRFETSMFLHRKIFDLIYRLRKELKIENNDICIIQKNYKKIKEDMGCRIQKSFGFHHKKYFASYYLISFLMSQMSRTQKYYPQMLSFKEKINIENTIHQSINEESIIFFIIHSYMVYIYGLLLINDRYKILLLDNKTDLKFLTSDQPMFNIYGAVTPDNICPEKFEIYYPLNPSLAMLFTNRECYKDIDIIDINIDSVKEYNKLTEKMCLNMVYSCNPFE